MCAVKYDINLPLRISWQVNKKGKLKEFLLNLNVYRNAHFRVLHSAKIAYHEHVKDLVKDLPIMQGVTITYTLYMGSARKADLSNICCIIDKFFCDSLVTEGKIPDDNIDYIKDIKFKFAGIDRDNPRVVASITPA